MFEVVPPLHAARRRQLVQGKDNLPDLARGGRVKHHQPQLALVLPWRYLHRLLLLDCNTGRRLTRTAAVCLRHARLHQCLQLPAVDL